MSRKEEKIKQLQKKVAKKISKITSKYNTEFDLQYMGVVDVSPCIPNEKCVYLVIPLLDSPKKNRLQVHTGYGHMSVDALVEKPNLSVIEMFLELEDNVRISFSTEWNLEKYRDLKEADKFLRRMSASADSESTVARSIYKQHKNK
ncbi:MAG: hypothetical protein OCC45_04190 [Desulfotalea sp.]